jgi:hypothetical protein
MIMSAPESELGLQEQIFAGQQATLNRRQNCLADRRLVVVPALIGGIDASKSLFEGEFREALRIVLFPGRPIQKPGHLNAINRHRPLGHGSLRLAGFNSRASVFLTREVNYIVGGLVGP